MSFWCPDCHRYETADNWACSLCNAKVKVEAESQALPDDWPIRHHVTLRDYRAMFDNLTATQKRCNELLEEAREERRKRVELERQLVGMLGPMWTEQSR